MLIRCKITTFYRFDKKRVLFVFVKEHEIAHYSV